MRSGQHPDGPGGIHLGPAARRPVRRDRHVRAAFAGRPGRLHRPGTAGPPTAGTRTAGTLWRAVPLGVVAGLTFAVPAVAWALLAHLPVTGSAPPLAPVLVLAAIAVAVSVAVETVRSAGRSTRPGRRRLGRGPAGWRIGGPRSFAGLLATQALLHLSMPGRASADPAAALLCHNPSLAAGGASAQRPSLDLTILDSALVAAARRAGTGGPVGSGHGHGHGGPGAGFHLGGLSVAGFGPSGPTAPGVAMLLAHALAATMMFWWARRGADVLAATGRLLASRLGIAWPIPILAAPRAARPARPALAESPLPVRRLRYAVARRGPPRPAVGLSSRNVRGWPEFAVL